jgi:hypothetical protein
MIPQALTSPHGDEFREPRELEPGRGRNFKISNGLEIAASKWLRIFSKVIT